MNESNHNPFKILSLSGGGYRGLFTAKVLQLIEEKAGGSLWEKFDLIAGTSIGGINALTIAAGIPAQRAVDLFLKEGTTIFRKMPAGWFGFFRPRYTNTGLIEVLKNLFEDRTIADLKTNIIIPAVNYTKGAPQIFKTSHNPNLIVDSKKPLVDVALSTSAAPTYFPIHRTSFGDMVDGGLVANHPGLFAVIEAKKFLGIPESNIHLLHIGTMTKSGPTTSGQSLKYGIQKWLIPRPRLIDLILSSQEQSSGFILGFILKDKYFVIDQRPSKEQIDTIGLDKISQNAQTVLLQSAEAAFQNATGNETLRTTFQLGDPNGRPNP